MRRPGKSLGPCIAALLLAASALPVHAAATTWKAIASMPKSRAYMAATEGLNSDVYAFGGKEVGSLADLTDVYNPTTRKWSTLPAAPGIGANPAAATGPAGKIYAIGSGVYDGSECWDTSATVDALSTKTNTWVTQAPLPDARGAVAAVSGPGGFIYALGGATSDCGQADSTNEVDRFNPNTDSWGIGVPMLTQRDSFAAVVGTDGRIYAIGGEDYGTSLSSVEAFSSNTNSWSYVASLPTASTVYGAALGKDGRIYVMDGTAFEAYSIATNSWATLPAPPGSNPYGFGPMVAVGSSHSVLDVVNAGNYKAAATYTYAT